MPLCPVFMAATWAILPDRSSLDRELVRARETENPHLEKIPDPGELDAELVKARHEKDEVRPSVTSARTDWGFLTGFCGWG